jgi:Xaa-Pro aminopeptidase
MTENEAWALFTGRAFALGGEYVEARLLSSGPRTNPWFREAGDRRIEPGDLVSFDTDLIGPAGYLADVSRTYLVDGTKPTARQQRPYADAEAFLRQIIGELTPGRPSTKWADDSAVAFLVPTTRSGIRSWPTAAG